MQMLKFLDNYFINFLKCKLLPKFHVLFCIYLIKLCQSLYHRYQNKIDKYNIKIKILLEQLFSLFLDISGCTPLLS